MARRIDDAPSMSIMGQDLDYGYQYPKGKSLNKTTTCQDGPILDKRSVNWPIIYGVVNFAGLL